MRLDLKWKTLLSPPGDAGRYATEVPDAHTASTLISDINPYTPGVHTPDASQQRHGRSTWKRNLVCLAATVIAYSAISFCLAATGNPLPSQIMLLLFVSSFVTSAWANFHVASRIGLHQGGMPIMVVLVFGWAFSYILLALLGGGIGESLTGQF